MKKLCFYFAILFLWGCSASSQQDVNTQLSASSASNPTTIKAMTQSDYQKLSGEKQYQLVNKLLATLFKGLEVDDFFNLMDGVSKLSLKEDRLDINKVRQLLAQDEPYYSNYIDLLNQHYFDSTGRQQNTRTYPMAVLYTLPLSRTYYNRWMAYILANTILFSPAYELDSVDFTDVESVYNNLVFMLDDNKSIADIVYAHVTSEENWRRFRSPEDNTREMMEIYLRQFIDDEVPKASTACKNWYLSSEAEGYQLRKGLNVNLVAQQSLLGRNDIVSCEDFYRALSQHPALIKTVIQVLVEHFFVTRSAPEKQSLANEIAATQPTTFKQIFDLILFSKTYLMETVRTKSFEESFLSVASRIKWYAGKNFFYDLTDNNPGDMPVDLSEIKQNPFSYKLGRSVEVPLDSLSFAYYHKSLRDQLLLDRRGTSDPSNLYDGGWRPEFIGDPKIDRLSDQDFIHYLFLSVITRKATQEELGTLEQLFADNNISSRLQKTYIVLDYLSRLSELYFYSPIQEAS